MNTITLAQLTTKVVSSYSSSRSLSETELTNMISFVGRAFQDATNLPPATPIAPVKQKRAYRRKVAEPQTTAEALNQDASPEGEPVVGEWNENEETGAKTPPEPMF